MNQTCEICIWTSRCSFHVSLLCGCTRLLSTCKLLKNPSVSPMCLNSELCIVRVVMFNPTQGRGRHFVTPWTDGYYGNSMHAPGNNMKQNIFVCVIFKATFTTDQKLDGLSASECRILEEDLFIFSTSQGQGASSVKVFFCKLLKGMCMRKLMQHTASIV